jgi:NAD(P)-dependent dehydrogenase (short-subunit alcohol dehydrogenase family)
MARIFITGSSDGLGKMAATLLIDQGHRVVLHARNEQRAADALKGNPKGEAVLVAELSQFIRPAPIIFFQTSPKNPVFLSGKRAVFFHWSIPLHRLLPGYICLRTSY